MYSSQEWYAVGVLDSTYHCNWNAFLTRTGPIDRVVQEVVLTSLQARMLYQSH